MMAKTPRWGRMHCNYADYMLTTTQTQTGLAPPIFSGTNVLHLHLAHLANHLPQHQEPASGVPI